MHAAIPGTLDETKVALSPSARLHAARQAIVSRVITAWGLLNIGIIILQLFIAPFGFRVGVNIGNLNKYFMFSFVAWIAVVLLRRAAPLRIPAAIILLILVQFWFTISTVVAQLQLGTHTEFFAGDYSLTIFVLCFFQGAMLANIAPWTRGFLAKTLIGICLLSAVVAVLQFANFPPAIAIGNLLVVFEDITNWAGQGGIRAVGIFPSVALPVTYNLLAIGIICGALLFRKLRPLEIGLVILLSGVMLMSQVRNATVLIALVMLPLIVLFVRRHKVQALPYVVAAVLALLLMIWAGGDRFQYMFSGDTSTFDFRRETLWPQAWSILERRPWFGVGVDPSFAGFDTFTSSRWSEGYVMDNGYLVAIAYGGIPAVTFIVLAIVSGFVSSIRLLVRRPVDRYQAGYYMAAAIVALIFGYGMIFGNLITNASMAMFYFVIAGMAMPKLGENLNSMVSRLRSSKLARQSKE